MVAVPLMPLVTTPAGSTLATAEDPELHTPPDVGSLKVVVLPPGHMTAVPVIGAGRALTLTVVMALQPVGSKYVTSVVPAEIPVTIPLPLICVIAVATAVLLLLHVPP